MGDSALSGRELARLKAREEAGQRRERERLEREQAKDKKAAERCKRMRQHIQKCPWIHSIAEAPVFRPSPEEFADPVSYVLSIREEASKYGICKIIPPYPATTTCFQALRCSRQKGDKKDFRFPTRQQVIRTISWDDLDRTRFWASPPKNVSKYVELAEAVANKVFGSNVLMPVGLVENEYWRNMAIPFKADERTDLTVEYGDNVEGSGFSNEDDDLLGSSEWNLNHLPKVARSVLRLLKGSIPGVTEPMLYIGMLFSTFSWHTEDLNLYSVNFHHAGAPKTWYGVPSSDAEAFEKVAVSKIYKAGVDKLVASGISATDAERKALDTLLQKTTVFSPEHLLQAGVRTYRCTQHAGEFVLTFPRAYHSGFCNGYNMGEAVNFALRDWAPFGADCAMRMRYLKRLQAIPLEQLLCLEMEVLQSEMEGRRRERGGANDSAADSGGAGSPPTHAVGFASWLLEHGAAAIDRHDRPLVTTFCQLVRWQNRRAQALLSLGARQATQQFDNSVPCSCCKDMCFLSFVMRSGSAEPFCLRCCQLPHAAASDEPADHAGVLTSPRNGSAAGGAPVPAADLTVFCHHKIAMYHRLAAAYCALVRAHKWQPSQDEMRAAGLTDRFELPRFSRRESADYTAENLDEEYEWAGSLARSPNSCKSDTDTLTLLDAPLDTQLVETLNELLPAPAADLPPPAPVKPSRAQGGKGGRAPRGKVIKPPPRASSPTPAVRVRKPSLASMQYLQEGGDTELSGSMGGAPWAGGEGDAGDDTNSAGRGAVARHRQMPPRAPSGRVAMEKTLSLEPAFSRGTQEDDAEEHASGTRKRPQRAAAADAVAMWKVGGRAAPEDMLAEDASRIKRQRRGPAGISGKRSEEHSGDSNLGQPKGSVYDQGVRSMSDLSKPMPMGGGGGGPAAQYPQGLTPSLSMLDDAMASAHPGPSVQTPTWQTSSARQLSGALNALPLRGAPRPGLPPRVDPWLAQLEYSAGLNQELGRLLDYFQHLPPVELSFPPRGMQAAPDDAAMGLGSMHDPMGGHPGDRRRHVDMNVQAAPGGAGWAGAPPGQGAARGSRDLGMMSFLTDSAPPQRSNSQMLGHGLQVKMSDVDPLTSMTLPYIPGQDGPQSPASSSHGRGRPRSRQGARTARNSGPGVDHGMGVGGGQDGSQPQPSEHMTRARGKPGVASSPVNMPSLAANLSIPGSMDMAIADLDNDHGDFNDFMKLLGSDNHELEGLS